MKAILYWNFSDGLAVGTSKSKVKFNGKKVKGRNVFVYEPPANSRFVGMAIVNLVANLSP